MFSNSETLGLAGDTGTGMLGLLWVLLLLLLLLVEVLVLLSFGDILVLLSSGIVPLYIVKFPKKKNIICEEI